MLFPAIEDYATANVATVPHDATLRAALGEMTLRNVRDVVVTGPAPGDLGIFTIVDAIRFRARHPQVDVPLERVGYRRLTCVPAGTSITQVLEQVSSSDEYIGVLDGRGGLRGVASYSDVVSGLDPRVLVERQCIGELLSRHQISMVGRTARLHEVLPLLKGVADAVLIGDGDRPEGIITTKDAVRLVGCDVPLDSLAVEHMHAPVETVSPDVSVKSAVEFLRQKNFKRLIVADAEGRVLGAIKQRDLLMTAYSRWAEVMRVRSQQLYEMVDRLQRRNAELSYIAVTDTLTGLDNRAMFERALAGEVKRCELSSTRTFSLLLLDVDNFKAINDRYGHASGDEVLRIIAGVLERESRSSDLSARWGGEEFVALLPNTGLEAALEAGERMRRRVSEAKLPVDLAVTVSIGVAAYRQGDTPAALLERADRAMYAAKQAGRNRVQLESDAAA